MLERADFLVAVVTGITIAVASLVITYAARRIRLKEG